MRFNRTLRNHMPTPYPHGYQAPSTALFNVDKVELLLGETTRQALKPWNRSLPKYLDLRVSVIPEPLVDGDVTATVVTDSGPTQPLLLYANTPVIKSLSFVYTGAGCCYDQRGDDIKDLERTLTQNNAVMDTQHWQHPFYFQEQAIVHQPVKGEQAVWAYGGDYHPGAPWYEVAQSFFTLSAEGMVVNVKKTPLSLWQDNGLTPPLTAEYGGRQVLFVGSQAATPYANLYDHLVQGGLTLTLRPEVGAISQQYRSEELRPISADQAIITFIMG